MTQKNQVLKYLQTYKSGLTSKDAWDKFGISRLADIIWKLKRKDGYKIDKEIIKVQTRSGYAHVARYTMGI